MQHIRAFLLGIAEFRLSFTAYYADQRLARAYDHGREFAHRITLRRFDA
jgi:hypothetical protein